ncbi:testis-specific Y-encoded-like protein 1 [Rhynchocyon petersi]
MNGLGGGERTPLPETCRVTAPNDALGEQDPQDCRSLGAETDAAGAMAETAESTSVTVALPPAQLPEDWSAPPDAAGCEHNSGIVNEGRDPLATAAGKEEASPRTALLEAAAASLRTDGGPKRDCQDAGSHGPGGEKALEACDEEGFASAVIVGAKAEEARTGRCAGVAGSAEEKAVSAVKAGAGQGQVVAEEMEVGEKPRDEEMERGAGDGVLEGVQEKASPPPLPADLRINPLQAIQQELDTVTAQADRAFLQLEQKFGRMRRHYLERRNYIIQSIPGFWATAFRNHPQLSAMIRGQDAEMVRYITNLEVKELRQPRTGCKFKFFFRRNPYFRNKLITKEYEVRSPGQVVSLSTPIIWRRGHEPQSLIRRNQGMVCSFFTWFSDHSLPESDRIAAIIKEDLWPNPLQYYLLRDGARRPRRRPVREPVEIPRPFGFQSG